MAGEDSLDGRTPRPQWPYPTIAAFGLAGHVTILVAASKGGPCLGSFTAFFACLVCIAILQIALVTLRPIVWDDYLKSLALLKQDPGNADLWEHSLELGREYASLTITSTGQYRYTEAMVQSELQAACAGS